MENPSEPMQDPEVAGVQTDGSAPGPEDQAGNPQGEPGHSGPSAQSDIQILLDEREQFKTLALRTRAEFENYQKRVARDMQQERKYANMPLVGDLLPALDNLDRAIESGKDNPQAAGILEGIRLVRKQLLDGFEKHGVTPIPTTDTPFDPNMHQAVMQQPSADKPAMTVLQTLQNGYMLHDRVVRPAQVIVSTEA